MREIKRMQPMPFAFYQAVLSRTHLKAHSRESQASATNMSMLPLVNVNASNFEGTFENLKRREVKQMQPI